MRNPGQRKVIIHHSPLIVSLRIKGYTVLITSTTNNCLNINVFKYITYMFCNVDTRTKNVDNYRKKLI